MRGARSNDKGYDTKGGCLPGRELNLRKRGTIAARKPGDLLPGRSDDEALIARAHAVINGETLGPKR